MHVGAVLQYWPKQQAEMAWSSEALLPLKGGTTARSLVEHEGRWGYV